MSFFLISYSCVCHFRVRLFYLHLPSMISLRTNTHTSLIQSYSEGWYVKLYFFLFHFNLWLGLFNNMFSIFPIYALILFFHQVFVFLFFIILLTEVRRLKDAGLEEIKLKANIFICRYWFRKLSISLQILSTLPHFTTRICTFSFRLIYRFFNFHFSIWPVFIQSPSQYHKKCEGDRWIWWCWRNIKKKSFICFLVFIS